MVYCIMSQSIDSNCYIICGRKTALIDSGINPAPIFEKITEAGIGIDYLINTHSHFDHVSGNAQIKEKTGAVLCIYESGADVLETGDDRKALADWFNGTLSEISVDVRLSDGQKIDLGGINLEVIHTPGHTEDSICLYEPETKSLFSGDTVFADGVGRTDLPGGSLQDLKESLERLMDLHSTRGVAIIYPGHGPVGYGDDIKRIYHIYF